MGPEGNILLVNQSEIMHQANPYCQEKAYAFQLLKSFADIGSARDWQSCWYPLCGAPPK